MPLLRVELPRRVTPRVCRKTERYLQGCRVHQLLNAPEEWPGPPLPPLNPTRRLWRQKAEEAALFLLEREGVAPSRATVEFCGDRFSRDVEALILSLVRHIRTVSLALPAPEAFLWRLQRDYGVSPQTGPGDVSLCFSPVPRRCAIPLWQARPQVAGACLRCPGPEYPEGCPVLPLLAALEEQGRIGAEQIQICADFS